MERASRRPGPRAAPGADVLHVTKGSKASCNTAKAQGGIQAAVGDDDSPEQHATDIVASSHDTADPALAGILAEEAPGAIAWLEELGVGFSREGDGYRLARCGGASRRRLLQVGDRTGHAIATALRKALDAQGGRIHDHAALVGLERTNGHFTSTSSRPGSASTSTPARSCSRPAAAATPRPAGPAS